MLYLQVEREERSLVKQKMEEQMRELRQRKRATRVSDSEEEDDDALDPDWRDDQEQEEDDQESDLEREFYQEDEDEDEDQVLEEEGEDMEERKRQGSKQTGKKRGKYVKHLRNVGQKRSAKKHRPLRPCPIEGCVAQKPNLVRHLKYFHPSVAESEYIGLLTKRAKGAKGPRKYAKLHCPVRDFGWVGTRPEQGHLQQKHGLSSQEAKAMKKTPFLWGRKNHQQVCCTSQPKQWPTNFTHG